MRIIKSRWSWMICPISIYLRPAEQVGLHKVCTRLCIEFLLLTLSCKVENPSLFKNFFLIERQSWLLPKQWNTFSTPSLYFAYVLLCTCKFVINKAVCSSSWQSYYVTLVEWAKGERSRSMWTGLLLPGQQSSHMKASYRSQEMWVCFQKSNPPPKKLFLILFSLSFPSSSSLPSSSLFSPFLSFFPSSLPVLGSWHFFFIQV